MYTERIEKFSLKNFLVMLLTIGLVVVFILWLLPKKNNNKKVDTPVKEETDKKSLKYEYKLIIEEEGIWSDWSSWQLDKVDKSDTVEVETNEVNRLVGQVTKIKNGKKIKEDIYSTTIYYRYRTYTVTKESETFIKWSKSDNDLELLNEGYTLTGNVK